MADLLQSELLLHHGFLHGFSLRTAGQSLTPFDSLNLARTAGDDSARVEANHRLLAQEVGYASDQLFEVSQVHGSAVWRVKPGQRSLDVRRQRADALLACEPPAAIGVRVADCVALLLADPETGSVAAIHAGWRGVVAGVVPAGVRALLSAAQAPAQRVLAAAFPHIRACCFEVGADVADRLASACPGEDVVRTTGEKPHVDLSAAVRAQLRALGLSDDRIEDIPGCTRCEPGRFFSYRRDGKISGRHLAVIAVRSDATARGLHGI